MSERPMQTMDGARLLADGSPAMTPDALLDRLTAEGIAHHTVEHPPVFTVEEARALRGQLAGSHCKNLFLRNKKGGMWLVTVEEERRVDLKDLGERLGAGRFSFGSPDRLMLYLGVVPGSVTPLALVNDVTGAVTFAIDSVLLEGGPLNVHPLTNDRTTAIAPRDLLRFCEATGHGVQVLTFHE